MGRKARSIGRILAAATLLVVAVYLFSLSYQDEYQRSYGMLATLFFVLGLICLLLVVVVLVHRRPNKAVNCERREMAHPRTEHQRSQDFLRRRRKEIDNVLIDQHLVDRRL